MKRRSGGLVLPILLEVNVAGESSKSGFAPGDLLPRPLLSGICRLSGPRA